MKKSIKSKAVDVFVSAIINALYVWARKWGKNAYFYILIGDDSCQDVAWSNTQAVEENAIFPVVCNPKAAALFENLRISYDLLVEEHLKDPEYDKVFQEPTIETHEGWYSEEFAK